jgi:hypothetical protein
MPDGLGLIAFIVFIGLIAVGYGYFAAWMTRRR